MFFYVPFDLCFNVKICLRQLARPPFIVFQLYTPKQITSHMIFTFDILGDCIIRKRRN